MKMMLLAKKMLKIIPIFREIWPLQALWRRVTRQLSRDRLLQRRLQLSATLSFLQIQRCKPCGLSIILIKLRSRSSTMKMPSSKVVSSSKILLPNCRTPATSTEGQRIPSFLNLLPKSMSMDAAAWWVLTSHRSVQPKATTKLSCHRNRISTNNWPRAPGPSKTSSRLASLCHPINVAKLI